jgi:hypothetical protein
MESAFRFQRNDAFAGAVRLVELDSSRRRDAMRPRDVGTADNSAPSITPDQAYQISAGGGHGGAEAGGSFAGGVSVSI